MACRPHSGAVLFAIVPILAWIACASYPSASPAVIAAAYASNPVAAAAEYENNTYRLTVRDPTFYADNARQDLGHGFPIVYVLGYQYAEKLAALSDSEVSLTCKVVGLSRYNTLDLDCQQ